MTLPPQLLEAIRVRAGFACEYCGVTESDAGGELTVDHFQPRSESGSDDLSNLIYCCFRCNLHKADYWPRPAVEGMLWNPRKEPADRHLLLLADGRLYPITPAGVLTLDRLRLNRPGLIALRLRRSQQREEVRLLSEIKGLLMTLQQIQSHYEGLISRQDSLLHAQQMILDLLTRKFLQ